MGKSMPNLIELVPKVDDLLILEPEDLGVLLLRVLADPIEMLRYSISVRALRNSGLGFRCFLIRLAIIAAPHTPVVRGRPCPHYARPLTAPHLIVLIKNQCGALAATVTVTSDAAIRHHRQAHHLPRRQGKRPRDRLSSRQRRDYLRSRSGQPEVRQGKPSASIERG